VYFIFAITSISSLTRKLPLCKVSRRKLLCCLNKLFFDQQTMIVVVTMSLVTATTEIVVTIHFFMTIDIATTISL